MALASINYMVEKLLISGLFLAGYLQWRDALARLHTSPQTRSSVRFGSKADATLMSGMGGKRTLGAPVGKRPEPHPYNVTGDSAKARPEWPESEIERAC